MDIERRKYRETAEGETEHWTEKQTARTAIECESRLKKKGGEVKKPQQKPKAQ